MGRPDNVTGTTHIVDAGELPPFKILPPWRRAS
ncbi:hypothetical protein FrEUN1fDRAFT_0043 [Parafrankia sp. EUN1f]|nr:hypothetical protein FrEUN1fDRAFT_0043 [Parafrankia sp. EUN1f]